MLGVINYIILLSQPPAHIMSIFHLSLWFLTLVALPSTCKIVLMTRGSNNGLELISEMVNPTLFSLTKHNWGKLII